MNWKSFLNVLGTAALSGAASAAAVHLNTGASPELVGSAAATGALVAVINHLRTPPAKSPKKPTKPKVP